LAYDVITGDNNRPPGDFSQPNNKVRASLSVASGCPTGSAARTSDSRSGSYSYTALTTDPLGQETALNDEENLHGLALEAA
jgi:hypothetical protein